MIIQILAMFGDQICFKLDNSMDVDDEVLTQTMRIRTRASSSRSSMLPSMSVGNDDALQAAHTPTRRSTATLQPLSSPRNYDTWPSSDADLSQFDPDDHSVTEMDDQADRVDQDDPWGQAIDESAACRHARLFFADRRWWDPRDVRQQKEDRLSNKRMQMLVNHRALPEELKDLLVC